MPLFPDNDFFNDIIAGKPQQLPVLLRSVRVPLRIVEIVQGKKIRRLQVRDAEISESLSHIAGAGPVAASRSK